MDYRSRIQDIEEHIQAVPEWAQNMVETQPLSAVCTVFAAGFVMGAGLVGVVLSSQQPTTVQAAENYGQRIAKSFMKSLPHQLTELWQG